MAQRSLFFPYFLCHVYSAILHRTDQMPACFLRAFLPFFTIFLLSFLFTQQHLLTGLNQKMTLSSTLYFFCIFCILFFFPKEIMSTSVILAHSSTQERRQILSNNLCLSTTCCQEQKEQSNVPDDYSLAEVSVHHLQSNLYS